ncbi:UDP-glucose 6-dehydrogenase [Colletotrichum trifolii]|uniref:UDP-glucose 6-dehydrogenase n=1 Tax=Colletotrichum trifolii TaxID=5466 RepID=A0A4R8RJE5_COLTR|nr:UDP-glucose 6-dehydrogenase [Colletotrichum trifolii]
MAVSFARAGLVSIDSSSTAGSMVSQSPALSPGHSDAGSGSGTPNSSPPASRPRSPDLKHHHHATESVSDLEPLEPLDVKNVCFVGAGFVGGPTAALIALHNPKLTVNVVDLNADRIAAWNSPHLPLPEAGLPKIVRIARDGTNETTAFLPSVGRSLKLAAREPNLFFSTDVRRCIGEADVVLICVNTPTKTYGLGAGYTADLSALEGASETVAKYAKNGAVVVEKSTVPTGTARMINEIMAQYQPDSEFEIVSNPEFLAEGTAVRDLMHPDRILIGSSTTPAGIRAANALKSVYSAWVPPHKILTVNTWSSELTKLVANAMLAQRISSINSISALCEELGADVEEISRGIGADARLGKKFLHAGVGFGGSCFEKDILNLTYMARALHLDAVADYWMGVLDINRYQRERFAQKVHRALNGNLRRKKVAMLGFAFKENTNDTRNSIAVHIIAELAREMPAEIAIFDPGCDPEDVMAEVRASIHDARVLDRVKVRSTWREAVEGSSAVCILTPWYHFRYPKKAQVSARRSSIWTSGSGPGSGPGDADDATRDEAAAFFKDAPLSEMDVVELEKFVSRGASHHAPLDPLKRIKPEVRCPDACKGCLFDAASEDLGDPIDWEWTASVMKRPRLVLDGRNVVSGPELEKLGFTVQGIGKGLGI